MQVFDNVFQKSFSQSLEGAAAGIELEAKGLESAVYHEEHTIRKSEATDDYRTISRHLKVRCSSSLHIISTNLTCTA